MFCVFLQSTQILLCLAMHTGCYIIQVQGDPKSEVTLVTQIFKVLINVVKYLWH